MEEIINQVSQYLFDEESGQDLFKSLYFAKPKPEGKYKNQAEDFLQKTCEGIPKYAYQNTTFAYAMANNLYPAFISAVEASTKPSNPDENGKTPNTSKRHQKPVEQQIEEAIQKTMSQLGMTEEMDGQRHQEEIQKQVQEDGEEIVYGLMASKDPNFEHIAHGIKRLDASLKSVQKTLRNISAISDSLLAGINKVKSDYSEFGLDYGRDLSKIDTSQLAYLSGTARQLFLLKYAKGELLQESSEEKKGLGDLLIAIDTSGSTDNHACGNYKVLDLEMGIALAISKIAAKHKCKARLCMHTTKVHHDSEWLRGNTAINQYFADLYLNQSFGRGDNDFNNVLATLCEWMEARQYTSNRKPGIVFITDGIDSINQQTINRIKKLKTNQGIKMYTYFVVHSDPRQHAQDLVNISEASYWIDAKKPIEKQIDAFLELK